MRTVYDSNDPVNDRKLSLTAKEAVVVKLLEDRGFGVQLSRREVTEPTTVAEPEQTSIGEVKKLLAAVKEFFHEPHPTLSSQTKHQRDIIDAARVVLKAWEVGLFDPNRIGHERTPGVTELTMEIDPGFMPEIKPEPEFERCEIITRGGCLGYQLKGIPFFRPLSVVAYNDAFAGFEFIDRTGRSVIHNAPRLFGNPDAIDFGGLSHKKTEHAEKLITAKYVLSRTGSVR